MNDLLGFLPQITLWGSVAWFYLVTIGFIIAIFASDFHKNGFYIFGSVVLFSVVNYVWGDVNLLDYVSWPRIGIYLGIGFLYSLVRTYFYGRTYKDKYLKSKTHSNQVMLKESRTDYLKDNVFRWWFAFPISVINWLLTDLLKDTWNMIYSKLEVLFEKVFNMGSDGVDNELNKTT